jgi:hypothetical protein
MKTYAHFIIYTSDIPGGPDAILGPGGCGKDVAEISGGDTIYLDLEVHDERIAKVAALLEAAGKDPSFSYFDRYTEEELQAAPLLSVDLWKHVGTWTSRSYGVTYDSSQACPTCATGVRQSSPLIVNGGEMLVVNKHRVSCAGDKNFLVRDTDVEKLIAANVTGVNFWPIKAIYKSGAIGEVRWQQALIENVLPPMAPSTQLVEEGKCPTCSRGRKSEETTTRTPRITYRREDLKNICDFNLSWEAFGRFWDYGKVTNGETDYRCPSPRIFITPKVMNIIRGKTKKEQNVQGCNFTPIWIEDETGQQTLAVGKPSVNLEASAPEAPPAKPAPKRVSKRR